MVSMPHSAPPRSSIYQHPLAYLVGLEGVALMRAFAGEFDHEFTLARLAELRLLLDTADALGDGAEIPPMSSVAGYDGWAANYDDPGNGLFATEELAVRAILDRFPAGVAVDAACGTGRHAAYLAQHRHQVWASTRRARCWILPGPRCRKGGSSSRTSIMVRSCQELLRIETADEVPTGSTPRSTPRPGEPSDFWSLHAWAPEATKAAYRDQPILIVWDFELADGQSGV